MVVFSKHTFRRTLAFAAFFCLVVRFVHDSTMLRSIQRTSHTTKDVQVASNNLTTRQRQDKQQTMTKNTSALHSSQVLMKNQTTTIISESSSNNNHTNPQHKPEHTTTTDVKDVKKDRNGTKIVIFLNAFFPKEERAKTRANVIIQEQLTQIANSYGGSQNPRVFVKPLNAAKAIDQARLHKMCHNTSHSHAISCTLLPYPLRIQGGEIDTLSELHRYCVHSASATSQPTRVVYLHNKGSFHASKANNNWRRAMTAATMTEECLNPPNASCTSCGLLFASPARMFTNLFPGNMFTASCEYVRKLLPPTVFQKRQEQMVQQARRSGKFAYGPKDHRGWVVGGGRYGAEHWIASHPHVTPCDLSPEPDYWFWENRPFELNDPNATSLFHWSMFPRPTKVPMVVGPSNDTDIRVRSFTLLAGQLFRHLFLYNTTPTLNSWMYDAFPDGAAWRACVQVHGSKVVDVVTGADFNRSHMAALCEGGNTAATK